MYKYISLFLSSIILFAFTQILIPQSNLLAAPILNEIASDNPSDNPSDIQGESTLGDFIWHDLNGNGLQDAGEPGIDGVTVQLYLDNGDFVFDPDSDELLSGLITGNNPGTPQQEQGWYDFSVSFNFERFHWVHIPPSNYAMGNALNGYTPTTSEVGANENIDSNFDPALIIETQFVADRNDADFGFVGTVSSSIGDRVWHDLNQDGLQGENEPGIPAVSISLHSAISKEQLEITQTDSMGRYIFEDLKPGEYYLVIQRPIGYQLTQPHISDDDTSDAENDSDADRTTGQTPTVLLNAGDVDTDIDMGLYQPTALGDRVWMDTNGNGIQDDNEAGLANVTVNLSQVNPDGQEALISVDTTDADGHYLFQDIAPGSYALHFVPPAGFVLTAPTQGDDTLDSDANPDGTTPTIDLAPSTALLDIDAGYYEPAQISGRLWHDLNSDSTQDSNEPGIPNMMVTLYDNNGQVLSEIATDNNGGYSFGGLSPGEYRVGFDSPELGDFDFSQPGDSDVDPNTGQTGVIALHSGGTVDQIDAGAHQSAMLGDSVWHDQDSDGIRDADESGLADVEVRLYEAESGDLIMITQSGLDGAYLFQDVPPGRYYVIFTPESGWQFSPSNQGDDPSLDSNANPLTGTTAPFELQSTQTEMTIDSGLYQTLSVAGISWDDSNGNGLLDDTEARLDGVVVQFYDESGTLLSTMNTEPDGSYQFDNLIPGNYRVDFLRPDGFMFTMPDQGDDDQLDSDVIISSTDNNVGQSIVQASLDEASSLAVNAGFYHPAALGDFVWTDINQNGLQDAGEAGIPDVTVTLYAGAGLDGDPVAQHITGESGRYTFTNLAPGAYILAFEALSDYRFTLPDQGADDSMDSDVDPTTGRSPTFTLVGNTVDHSWDAGLIPPEDIFLLGDWVWNDINGDGLQDDGEPGIQGVTVQLYHNGTCTDLAAATTTTDDDGFYNFPQLKEGDYCLQFDDLPVSWQVSPVEQGTADQDSDGLLTEAGKIEVAEIQLQDNDQQQDLGLSLAGEIEGLVWCESATNPNRAYDMGEDTGLTDIQINLWADPDCSGLASDIVQGVPLTTTQTDADGHYHFGDLAVVLDSVDLAQSADHSTCYVVEAAKDDSMEALTQQSCLNPLNDTQQRVMLHPAEPSSQENYFGLTPDEVYDLGDWIWADTDQDGIQDAGEQGLADIQVLLFAHPTCEGDPLESTFTDVNGNYLFHGLAAGSYCLEFQNIPEHWLISPPDASESASESASDDSRDSDAVEGKILNITLSEDTLDLDMGLYPPQVTIGDRVWLDSNGNGLQDTDEVGVPDVQVTLLFADGTSTEQVTITDQDGYYRFEGLLPDDYRVRFELATLPPDHVVTQPTAGEDTTLDSDGDPATGETAATGLLINGAENLALDMGIYQPVSVGDRAWEDWNANGLQDVGEPGVPGIQVALWRADGTVLDQQRVTDSTGHYEFTDLVPGEYYVTFDPASLALGGYRPTLANVGDDDALDSDVTAGVTADVIADITADISEIGRTDSTPFLRSGDADRTLDMGLVRPVELGGRVWLDGNNNGIQDGSESGLAGIGVTLFHGDGRPVETAGITLTTQTDAGGQYRFDDLSTGSYYVLFDEQTFPDKHMITDANVGTDDVVDSDADPTSGQSTPTAFLLSSGKDYTLDMGLHRRASVQIGDRVWLDSNANGLQDGDESGVVGVTVQLSNNLGVLMGEAVTDENGNYLFEDLPKGEYSLFFDLATLPSEHIVTAQNTGDDERKDSDVDPETGMTQLTGLLLNDDRELRYDMGVYANALLGDRVWDDLNTNGLQDEGEPGLAGVNVTLLDGLGTSTGRVITTDEQGNFLFDNIKPGTYMLQFELPPGYFYSPDHEGGVETVGIDSNVHAATQRTPPIELVSGLHDSSWDVGIYQGALIGDRVWADGDGNGRQDEDEAGIPGVVVELLTGDGESIESVTTDEAGNYRFEGVTPNDYYLRFNPPPGLIYTQLNKGTKELDSNVDPITGRSNLLTLSPGLNDLDQDAGFTQPASVGNYVWVDNDNDGVKDNDEPGISNMVVNIYNALNELVKTTITDGLGIFEFDNLSPGEYRLEFLTPAGYKFTEQNSGGPNDFNSDADPLNGRTQLITLGPGQADGSWGAGIQLADDDGGGTTAIDLVSFVATEQKDLVQVTWQTSAEVGTFGFQLYRSTNGDRNQAVRITPQIVRSQGAAGGTYQVDDTAVLPGVVYIYWLRETEISGRTREYGPTGFSAAAVRESTIYRTFLPMVSK